MATATTTDKPKIWTPGDWNAFFGFGTNILVNLMVLTTLLRFVIKMPDHLVFGRILPVQGWEAGLTWVFIQSFVLMAGGFIAPIIRKVTPRAALLGTLAGVSIAFISMRPAQDMFITPVIGIVCFAIILVSWFGGVRYFRGIPA